LRFSVSERNNSSMLGHRKNEVIGSNRPLFPRERNQCCHSLAIWANLRLTREKGGQRPTRVANKPAYMRYDILAERGFKGGCCLGHRKSTDLTTLDYQGKTQPICLQLLLIADISRIVASSTCFQIYSHDTHSRGPRDC
jgi:hypothetical protein